MSNKDKTVFLCPLDWGLGHASRIIPLVDLFRSSGYKVVIGGSGKSGELLQKMFTEVLFISLPSHAMRYYFRGSWFFLNIVFQMPALIYCSIREHFQLKKLAGELHFHTIVSDNRYGLFCSSTRNILITHQISPVLPLLLKWAEYPLYLILRRVIKCFDECWIPDFAGNKNLSGKLSHRYPLPANARYIGPLSRFSLTPAKSGVGHHDVVIVLSGPQPELNRITDKMIEQARLSDLNILIICGFRNAMQNFAHERPGLKIVSHLEPAEFRSSLENGKIIICMAGYSGIMDLIEIDKPAILMPTKGQSEQEYVSRYLASQKYFIRVPLSQVDLKNIRLYADELRRCRSFQHTGPQIEKIAPLIK